MTKQAIPRKWTKARVLATVAGAATGGGLGYLPHHMHIGSKASLYDAMQHWKRHIHDPAIWVHYTAPLLGTIGGAIAGNQAHRLATRKRVKPRAKKASKANANKR